MQIFRHCQHSINLSKVYSVLPVSGIISPYFSNSDAGGLKKLTSKIMIAFVTKLGAGGQNFKVEVELYDGTTALGPSLIDIPVSSITTGDDIKSALPALLATFCTTNGVDVPSTITWLTETTPSITRVFSNPSLAINTSRQASTTRDALVSASVDITAGLSLSGGTTGKVELKYADDTSFTTNVKTVQPASNGNTGTLTIGLALNQLGTATVTGIIPAGKYYRLVTTNVTGTPTYGTPALQEVLL